MTRDFVCLQAPPFVERAVDERQVFPGKVKHWCKLCKKKRLKKVVNFYYLIRNQLKTTVFEGRTFLLLCKPVSHVLKVSSLCASSWLLCCISCFLSSFDFLLLFSSAAAAPLGVRCLFLLSTGGSDTTSMISSLPLTWRYMMKKNSISLQFNNLIYCCSMSNENSWQGYAWLHHLRVQFQSCLHRYNSVFSFFDWRW